MLTGTRRRGAKRVTPSGVLPQRSRAGVPASPSEAGNVVLLRSPSDAHHATGDARGGRPDGDVHGAVRTLRDPAGQRQLAEPDPGVVTRVPERDLDDVARRRSGGAALEHLGRPEVARSV